jgi:hypothetical protein
VPPGDRLTGPAVTALRGGAASHGFSVDGGLLSVEPPPPGAVPRVPRTLAECEALAAIGSDGGALDVAADEWGLAIGYAVVTVSPGLPTDSSSWQSYGQTMPGPASYRNRLAWVVVFRTQLTASCPAVPVTTPPAPAPGRPVYIGHGYEVFLIDAATGGDALIYDETQPVPCGGTGVVPAGVAVPIEETSVPWTLDRRNPDRFSAVLTAFVPPCHFHDSVADVIPGTALVRVLAYGTVAARCGQPRSPWTCRPPASPRTSRRSWSTPRPACTYRAPATPHRATVPGRPPGPSSRSASSIAARRSPCTSVTCWPRLGCSPALITTTVCGFAAATASMSSSWADGRFSDGRSVASDSVSSETTTTAVEADWAALTAALMPGASAEGVPHSSCEDWPLIDSVYCCPAVSWTAAE